MSDFWEPWTPQVGQRVRVLARPECFYCRQEGAQETGVVGVVEGIRPADPTILEPGAAAHVYWVEADDFPCGLSHFAAGELEPVP